MKRTASYNAAIQQLAMIMAARIRSDAAQRGVTARAELESVLDGGSLFEHMKSDVIGAVDRAIGGK